jgi:histidine ammonia-lyase
LIHSAKPHPGQVHIAKTINEYILTNEQASEINQTHAAKKVQDAYSLRCIPQVHGPVHDLLTLLRELS